MKIPKDYMERVYAGWLGKIIGIRAGAPIEGWTYEKIKNLYGELDGYPVAYEKNFAADDDSNGPMFFIRALEDCRNLSEFSASDVAEALLNYAPYEHGFFWWGGYGISTEHTAYLNLRNGIPAPRSGSIAQNGATMAEQIGGQIFIDPWGLVAPGNPELAALLAEKAASVTHGGNGVYGGIFVACCISLAFVERDIRTILEKALAYIPAGCEYARVVKAVCDFYDRHPENWREGFRFVFENFGYDKYPGACHIIPNAGVMILSMLYGRGDFSNTVNICNMCGWDTDCNVGNVGCIMGVLCGTEGIDYNKWRAPVSDFLVCSGVIPSLNTMDIPFGATYFAKQAYRLAGEEPPAPWKDVFGGGSRLCHFEYPGSTHAIRCRSGGANYLQNTEEEARTGSRSLKATICGAASGTENFLYLQTYYRPEDFSDSRYDPFFSPLVYPGQTVHLSAMPCPPSNGKISVQIYARNGATGDIFRGEQVVVTSDGEKKWHDLSLDIPAGQEGYIREAGVIVSCIAGGFAAEDLAVYLDDLFFTGTPDYRIDFTKNRMEVWDQRRGEVAQFAKLKGHSYLDGPYLSLSCADFGEMYTGDLDWKDCRIAATVKPVTGEEHCLNVRVQGAMRSYAGGFTAGGKVCLKKNVMGSYTTLCETDFAWKPGQEYTLALTAVGNTLTLAVDGQETLSCTDEDRPLQNGCVGISVEKGSHCLYRDMLISGKGL